MAFLPRWQSVTVPVQPVSSIPELRQDGYKVLADFTRLKDFIQTAMQKNSDPV